MRRPEAGANAPDLLAARPRAAASRPAPPGKALPPRVSALGQAAFPGPLERDLPGLPRRLCPWATAAAERSPAAHRRSPPTAEDRCGADPSLSPQGSQRRGVTERGLPGTCARAFAYVCACACVADASPRGSHRSAPPAGRRSIWHAPRKPASSTERCRCGTRFPNSLWFVEQGNDRHKLKLHFLVGEKRIPPNPSSRSFKTICLYDKS